MNYLYRPIVEKVRETKTSLFWLDIRKSGKSDWVSSNIFVVRACWCSRTLVMLSVSSRIRLIGRGSVHRGAYIDKNGSASGLQELGLTFAKACSSTTAPVTEAPKQSYISAIAELSKARLSALVVFTTVGGYALSAPASWAPLAAATVGTSLAAASACTFNQVWEKENDKLMNRTAGRPLPSGRLTSAHAMGWGSLTATSSTALLATAVNPVTAALSAANIGLYSAIYTPSKTRSEWNTWVGALVGAIPPVMGWTAAGGNIASAEAGLLGSLLFLWQFPHFFSLAWFNRKDYGAGGFKMVPVADPTGIRTANLVRNYSLMLSTLPFAAYAADVTSFMFTVEGSIVNAYGVYLAQKFHQKRSNGNAKKVFFYSLSYLPLIGGFMVFHSNYWTNPDLKPEDSSLLSPSMRGRVSQWSEALFDNVPDVGYDRLGSVSGYGVSDSSESSPFAEEINRLVVSARAALTSKCVHEIFTGKASQGEDEGKFPDLCPVVAGEKAAEEASEKVVAGAEKVVVESTGIRAV